MSQSYNLQTVRELLTAAFNTDEIETLAFDMFWPVHNNFGNGMTKSHKIKMVVDEAVQHGRLPDLLAYIQRHNLYQYNNFAPDLLVDHPPEGQAPPDFRAQRLAAIQAHLAREHDLLTQYEEQLSYTDDPRAILRIKANIARQQEQIAAYRQEAADLGAAPGQPAPSVADPAAQAVQTGLTEINQKLDDLSRQVAGAEDRLAAGQQTIRQDVAAQRQAILAHMDQLDARHAAAIGQMVAQLDAHQLEVVELLLDAADRQQIAQWEAENLTRLAQQALLSLNHQRQGPDPAQWQRLLALLEQDTAWEQKVLLTLPLIPGILSYESEINVDLMGLLNESWRRLIARFR